MDMNGLEVMNEYNHGRQILLSPILTLLHMKLILKFWDKIELQKYQFKLKT